MDAIRNGLRAVIRDEAIDAVVVEPIPETGEYQLVAIVGCERFVIETDEDLDAINQRAADLAPWNRPRKARTLSYPS